MSVGDWLRTLGLERYEAAFRENNIDGDILPKLTAEDLKDLGVASVGDRRRLLEAIAALRPETPAEAETRGGAPPATEPRPAPETALPRARLVTRSELFHLVSAGISPSCFAISSARPGLPPTSTPRSGAISSALISTPPRRR
jgi:hypothetical protein